MQERQHQTRHPGLPLNLLPQIIITSFFLLYLRSLGLDRGNRSSHLPSPIRRRPRPLQLIQPLPLAFPTPLPRAAAIVKININQLQKPLGRIHMQRHLTAHALKIPRNPFHTPEIMRPPLAQQQNLVKQIKRRRAGLVNRRNHNEVIPSRHPLEVVHHLPPGLRVQPARRLIQKQNFRRRDQLARDPQPALLAPRDALPDRRADERVGLLGKTEGVEEGVDAAGSFLAGGDGGGGGGKAGGKVQGLAHRQGADKRVVLLDEAGNLAEGGLVRGREGAAVDEDAAFGLVRRWLLA